MTASENDPIVSSKAIVQSWCVLHNDNGEFTFTLRDFPGKRFALVPTIQGSLGMSSVYPGSSPYDKLSVPADSPLSSTSESRLNHEVTIDRKRLAKQRELRKEIDPNGIIIGSSPAILQLIEKIRDANLRDPLPEVLLGEPGVGKTHVARLLHESSRRRGKPFIVVAAALGGDYNIQRGEWVGYCKGHGIQGIDPNGRPGHLMNAEGGTLFIDEFGDLSPELQSIFVFVIGKQSIPKVGGDLYTPNVRCVFATNIDIGEAERNRRIRTDLLDRIGIRIEIPPLRSRRGDILQLARHFAPGEKFTPRCQIVLLSYQWPGNIRELKECVTQATARKNCSGARAIDTDHIRLDRETTNVVATISNRNCMRELWELADEIAQGEGFKLGCGLQHRVAEILDVSGGQASKMYKKYGLGRPASV